MRMGQRAMRTHEVMNIDAPVGGLNAVQAGGAIPATDCMMLWNMIAAEYGLRARLGSREWCTGLTGAANNQVRSGFYYHGSAKDGTKDRNFAVTSTGIWDCTASDDSPSQVLAFATSTGDAGRGVFHSYVATAGHFLVYCDEVNGFHLYTEATDSWATGSVTGVSAGDLVFATSWKGRLWFCERNTASAWYLDLNAVSGAATQLNLQFAAKFRHGGDLVGIWSWTMDGGSGIDDQLVFIGRGGDVAIYAGTSPAAAASFALRGVWYAGGLPKGRESVTSAGGDLLIAHRNGITPLSKLVAGGEGIGLYTTAKINNLFNSLMLTKATLYGWSLRIHPEDNSLLVTVPTTEGANTEQLAMSLVNGSWSRYRELPIFTCWSGGGKLYYGTYDGKVGINDGYADGRILSDANAYTAVQWSLLTGFHNLGTGRHKLVDLIRATILSDSTTPAYEVAARYTYDMAEIGSVQTGVLGSGDWDGGVWDTAVWGGEYAANQAIRGATGVGVDMAIAARGAAIGRTVLVRFDVTFRQGGVL